jgi:hypothetical protein
MFKAIAPSFHKPTIATHRKSNNDRPFPQTQFKAIAISSHKPTIATNLKSNSDRKISFHNYVFDEVATNFIF